MLPTAPLYLVAAIFTYRIEYTNSPVNNPRGSRKRKNNFF